jgi:hypothetical protein
MAGKAFTAMLVLEPADEFEIKLGRKQIRLVPVGGKRRSEVGGRSPDGAPSNKPLEWTGHHLLSAPPPQAPCLPLRGSVRRIEVRIGAE